MPRTAVHGSSQPARVPRPAGWFAPLVLARLVRHGAERGRSRDRALWELTSHGPEPEPAVQQRATVRHGESGERAPGTLRRAVVILTHPISSGAFVVHQQALCAAVKLRVPPAKLRP